MITAETNIGYKQRYIIQYMNEHHQLISHFVEADNYDKAIQSIFPEAQCMEYTAYERVYIARKNNINHTVVINTATLN